MVNKIAVAAVVIIVAVASFFAGNYYGGKRRVANRNNQFRRIGGPGGAVDGPPGIRGGQFRGGPGGGAVTGDIIAEDDKSITVKLRDGSTKIVLLSATTTISKEAEATKADLKVGERVASFGTANTDGSITAQNIQLNPMMRVFPSPTPQP